MFCYYMFVLGLSIRVLSYLCNENRADGNMYEMNGCTEDRGDHAVMSRVCRIFKAASSKHCIGFERRSARSTIKSSDTVLQCFRRRSGGVAADLTDWRSAWSRLAEPMMPAIAGVDRARQWTNDAHEIPASGARSIPVRCCVGPLVDPRQRPTVNDRWFATIYPLTNNSTRREFPIADVLLQVRLLVGIRLFIVELDQFINVTRQIFIRLVPNSRTANGPAVNR